ncbi:exosortase family protein XrtF [soil metagenome]
MLQLFKKYKSVLRFILIFLGSYFIFSLFYNIYLDQSKSAFYYPDFFTYLVSVQSEAVIEFFGYPAFITPHENEASMKLFINDYFFVRVVEGCNSISVIILFISFILSFFAGLRITLFYIFAGSVIVYVMNIVRIAILTIGIYEYPQHAELLHSIVFPLIIYGTVFILWLIWVRIFSKRKINESKI